MQMMEDQLAPAKSFMGVNPGVTPSWGKIELPVTFGSKDNYHTKNIIFDIADIALPYNIITGRLALQSSWWSPIMPIMRSSFPPRGGP
jgi:hypothetical protein